MKERGLTRSRRTARGARAVRVIAGRGINEGERWNEGTGNVGRGVLRGGGGKAEKHEIERDGNREKRGTGEARLAYSWGEEMWGSREERGAARPEVRRVVERVR